MRMRMLVTVLCGFAAAPVTVCALQAPANPAVDETTAIMTAAAAYARKELPSGSVMIDVDDGTINADVRARSVAASLGGQVGKATISCGSTRATCHLVGTQAAMRVMAPAVNGAEAAVPVQVWEERTEGARRMHHAVLEIHVTRTSGAWVAVGGRVRATT
jgi:hypothetical protein